MAVSRSHTWIAGEVLLASDLNSEFNNILTNGTAVAFPATSAISMGGFALNFDATNTIALTGTTNGVSLTGGALNTPQGADIASATTINLDTATGNLVDVTGTTTITTVTLSQGRQRIVRFTGTLTLTNGANLVLPGAANLQTASGDYAVFEGYAASVVRCLGYFRLNNHGTDVVSATTTVLDTATGSIVDVTGTTTITAITLADGRSCLVRFTGALTLTNGASLVLPGGANITTAAGDYAVFVGYTSSVVRCSSYVKASGAPVSMSVITNTLSGSVTLNNTGTYFDGPSVAQGTAGKWFVSGTVTVVDTVGGAVFSAKLWDGTTVLASTRMQTGGTNVPGAIALSSTMTSPAGNLRISVKDETSTSGQITFNNSGNPTDSTITALRIG